MYKFSFKMKGRVLLKGLVHNWGLTSIFVYKNDFYMKFLHYSYKKSFKNRQTILKRIEH